MTQISIQQLQACSECLLWKLSWLSGFTWLEKKSIISKSRLSIPLWTQIHVMKHPELQALVLRLINRSNQPSGDSISMAVACMRMAGHFGMSSSATSEKYRHQIVTRILHWSPLNLPIDQFCQHALDELNKSDTTGSTWSLTLCSHIKHCAC